jgi:hypothetical protein
MMNWSMIIKRLSLPWFTEPGLVSPHGQSQGACFTTSWNSLAAKSLVFHGQAETAIGLEKQRRWS